MKISPCPGLPAFDLWPVVRCGAEKYQEAVRLCARCRLEERRRANSARARVENWRCKQLQKTDLSPPREGARRAEWGE